jgi:putative PIN family toxin of toxin-antitoxin system
VRLVVDSSTLINALIGGRWAHFLDIVVDRGYTVYTSTVQMAELVEVVERRKFRKFFTVDEARAAMGDFYIVAEVVTLEPPFPKVCRDPKDDHVLALAKSVRADVLLSNDKDLLVLGSYGKSRIMDPGAFMKEYL